MIKNKLILFLIILLTACSNLNIRDLDSREKNQLTTQLENLKTNLKAGSTENIEDFFYQGIRNNYAVEELKKIDFSKVNIFYSQPEFKLNEATNVIAFTSYDNTLYMDLSYEFKDDKWKIIEIKERRR